MRSWLEIGAIMALVMMVGVGVVIGISVLVQGGGMDSVVEMLESGAWVVAGLAVGAILLFTALLITGWVGDAFYRRRGRSPQDDDVPDGTGVTGRPGLLVTISGLLIIAGMAVFGQFRHAADFALAVAGLALLAAVCWCCDKVAAKRRRWRELGRQGRWWDQR